jgi:LuxR family maltose regulon positive regulatory protein
MHLTAKVSRPQYPATMIDRPRLYRQLDRWPELRAIAILAPTGYGKSSLVSRWVDVSGLAGQAAWLSLHESDSDPRQFAHHLAAALDRVFPGALALAWPILQDSQGSVERVLNRLFAAWEDGTVAQSSGQHALLVLDDMHRVQSAEVDAAIRLILELGPNTLHLLLLARQRTNLSLARLYAHGQVAALHAADLQFTPGEVRQFLHRHGVDRATEAQATQLAQRCEGWITALQLAVLALRGDGSLADLDQALHGRNLWLADYLIGEVLDRQPPELRCFLLQTSILDGFNAQLCAAVTGDDAAYARLDAIAGSDLFLIPLAEDAHWFRYHHLFQEFLQHRLHAEAEPGLVAGLHRRAATWLAQAGDVHSAVRHYLAAGADDQAAALVESKFRATLLQDPYEAQALLRLLPDDLLAQRPRLMLDRCLLAAVQDDSRLARYVAEAERTLAGRPPDPDTARRRAELLMLQAGASFIHRDLAAAGEIIRQAAAHHAHLDDVHLALLRFLQMHLYGFTGQHAEMQEAAEAALAACERSHFVQVKVAVLREVARWSVKAGNSREANRRLEELFAGSGQKHPAAVRELAFAYLLAVENGYWQNHLEKAQAYLQTAMELGVELQDSEIAQVCRSLGRMLGAPVKYSGEAVGQIAETHRQIRTPRMADMLLEYETRTLIASGHSDLAWQVTQQCGLNLHNMPLDHVHGRLITYLSAAVAHDIDPVTTGRVLADTLAMTTEHSARFTQLRLLALTAWQQLKTGGAQAARTALAQAAHLARETGYVRVLMNIPELAAGDLPDDETGVPAAQRESFLTKREESVLALLAGGHTYGEIAEELFISIGTVRTHISQIYRKLGVHRRVSAVSRAQELGLLPAKPA